MYIVISRAVFLLVSNIVSAGPKDWGSENKNIGVCDVSVAGKKMFRSLNLWSRMKALLFRGWWIITCEMGAGWGDVCGGHCEEA